MSRRSLIRATLALGFMVVGAIRVAAQTGAPVVVILPFENAGSFGQDRESFDALRKGLAAIFAGELATHPSLRVVSRAEAQRAVTGQGLASVERFDRESVIRVGKAANAQYVVAGSFIDLYGEFRLDARLMDVSSGQIVKTVRSDPALRDRRDLDRMIRTLAERLAAGDPLPSGWSAREGRIPIEAITDFSYGLLYLDRGDRAKATELFRKAVELAPDFKEARQELGSP